MSAKNSGRSVRITTHSVATPSSRMMEMSRGIISATPPPCRVELSIQTLRPASFGTHGWASDRSCRTPSARCRNRV
nr:hypothetical protein [Anaeromyxobacter sp. SG29]